MPPKSYILSIVILLCTASTAFPAEVKGVVSPSAKVKSAPAVSDKTVARPISEEARTTKCCWCISGEDNQVLPYLDQSNCEGRTSVLLNTTCRSVAVIGISCALIETSRDDGNLRMISKNLQYYDDKRQLRSIAPPQTVLPAMVYTIPPPDVYCSCQRDPKDSAQCQVTKTEKFETTVLATEKMLPGQSGCTYEECEKIFPVEAYAKTCPAYVQGTP